MTERSEAAWENAQTGIDGFVRAHFYPRGTLRLHRSALGWDLLRAPVNVILAPVFLLITLASLAAKLAKWHRVAGWLGGRQLLLKTSVSRTLEAALEQELLQGVPLSPKSHALIADYTGTRSAVAEITTSLLVLLSGLALFGTATFGIATLAPAVSDFVGFNTAVARFPLGDGLGALWYGVFPVSLPVGLVIAIGIALAMVASIVTTFAGLIADPIQALLGIHHRRLKKLVAAISAAEEHADKNSAEKDSAGIAPEHILARFADITDAGLSLLRIFRS